jgi:hypothetical protein
VEGGKEECETAVSPLEPIMATSMPHGYANGYTTNNQIQLREDGMMGPARNSDKSIGPQANTILRL